MLSNGSKITYGTSRFGKSKTVKQKVNKTALQLAKEKERHARYISGLSFKAREQYIEEVMDVDMPDETVEAGLATVPPGEEGELHSHAGGDWEDIEENFQQLAHGLCGRHGDPRTRRDRVERQNKMWALQLDAMTDAYLAWQASGAPEDARGSTEKCSWTLPVLSFDFAGPKTFSVSDGGDLVNTVLARHGYSSC
ncbi:hypothetical protein K523DRAFT_359235 [Schizophyllum commune Tattone D]|nr:hypothetical protein K523DRAFT_359235 [Schizophyllum commune Tattone D]